MSPFCVGISVSIFPRDVSAAESCLPDLKADPIRFEMCVAKSGSFKIDVIVIPKEGLAGRGVANPFWYDTNYIK